MEESLVAEKPPQQPPGPEKQKERNWVFCSVPGQSALIEQAATMSSSSRAELLAANSGPRVPKAVAARAAKKKAAAAAAPPAEPDPYKVDYKQHGYSQAGGRGGGGGYDEGSDDEYDPGRDNPLRQNEQLELEQQAVTKSKEVTGNLRNVLRIAEDTKQIGSTTLVTLKDQGEQIARTHEKVVQIDQELAKVKRRGRGGTHDSFLK